MGFFPVVNLKIFSKSNIHQKCSNFFCGQVFPVYLVCCFTGCFYLPRGGTLWKEH